MLHYMVELGHSADRCTAESKFDSIQQNFNSIHHCCVNMGWGHLWTVVCIVKCTRKIVNSYFFGIGCKCTVA